MQIHALNQTNSSGNNTISTSSGMNNMFLQLLTAQLKSQGPFDPLDPNQFVNQLAQFNTLNEVMQIRQIVQQFAASITSPGDSGSQGGH